MKRVMLLAAMLAMVMVAAAPSFAQTGGAAVGAQFGEDNVQCVQNAVQQEFGKVQYNQYGDNINIQAISQECNINTGVVKTILVHKKIVPTATLKKIVPTATVTAVAKKQYKTVTATPTAKTVTATPTAKTVTATASPTATATAVAVLPDTGGASLIALGAGALLVGGGLLARRIVR